MAATGRRSDWGFVCGAGLLCLIAGCGDGKTPEQADNKPVEAAPVGPVVPETPKVDWKAKFDAVAQHLEAKQMDDAKEILAEAAAPDAELDDAAKTQLADLQKKLSTIQAEIDEGVRQEKLKSAEQQVADGNLEEATRDLATVLALAPTQEQRAAARDIEQTIEKHRQARRRMQAGIELLGNKDLGSIKSAQNILWEDEDVAYPLLLNTLKTEKPVLVANVMEMLRKMNRPERTLPALVAVFERPAQTESWPDVIKQLARTPQPGAGPALLKLALSAPTPEQATAALQGLAVVVDPPAESLVSLMPKLAQDAPDLAAALDAAYHAITVHQQQDLFARRGLDMELSAEQEAALAALPQRLEELATKSGTDPHAAEVAWAAKRLAMATRQMTPAPLDGVTVKRATGELPDSPPAAVLDGVWNSVDVKTMWRHPPKAPTTIVLDLGSERTVTGIRVWNNNEAAAAYRGWKDVEVFVSSSESPTSPVATAVVPPAPGLADTPDYGATIPVPFVRGRIVKLQFLSVWRDDGISGLSEIQILGY